MAARKPIVIVNGKQQQLPSGDTVTGAEPPLTAGTSSQYYRGDKSWQDLASAVRAVVLTGLSTATNAAVVATDTLLVGLGKLQAQINAREPTITGGTTSQYWRGDKTWQDLFPAVRSTVLVGLSTATATAVTAADSVLVGLGKLQAQVNGKLGATDTAAAAAKLDPGANINGVLFDGSADITVADSTKEPAVSAGTTSQYWRGDKAWTDFATSVRAAVLTGYAVGTNAALAATDTVLGALGKIQAQLNAKEGAITAGTTAQFWRGDKSWQDLATAVRAVVLTGLSTATSTAVVATDTVLVALGKLQAQVSAREPTIAAGNTAQFWRGDKSWQDLATAVRAAVLTGLSTATATAVTATDSILVAIGKLQAQVNNKLDSTGTAAAAAKLSPGASINGVAFTGESDITVADSTKEPAIAAGTTAQFWRGDKAWTDFATTARAVALTGYAVGTNAALAATDTVLAAFGKVQAQLNAKEASIAAGTTAQFWRGDKAWTDFATTVRATVLTGYAVGSNAALAATDTVLAAFGKIQAQLNAKEASVAAGTTAQYYRGDKSWQDLAGAVRSVVLTGLSTATATAITATDSILAALGKVQAQLNGKAASGNNSDITNLNALATADWSGVGSRIRGDWSATAYFDRTIIKTNVANGNTGLVVTPDGTGTNSALNLISRDDSTNYALCQVVSTNAQGYINVNGAGTVTQPDFAILQNGTTRYRILANGRSLINRSSEVDGAGNDLAVNGVIASQTGFRMQFGPSGVHANVFNLSWLSNLCQLWVDTSNIGSIAINPSDYRIKRDVKTLQADFINRVKDYRVVNFKIRDFAPFQDTDELCQGLIAHEAQKANPLAASGKKDGTRVAPDGAEVPDIQSLNDMVLITDCIGAIQQLAARVEALEAAKP